MAWGVCDKQVVGEPSMSKAMEQIVDEYVRLNHRQGLEDIRMHLQKLAIDLNGRPGYDFSMTIGRISQEIAVIDAGFNRFNSAPGQVLTVARESSRRPRTSGLPRVREGHLTEEAASVGGLTLAAVARPLTTPSPDRFSADRGGCNRDTGTCVVPCRREAALGSRWPRSRGKSVVRRGPCHI